MQPRRVDKNILHGVVGPDPQNLIPRRLGLAGRDTQFLAQQMIQQRRLANVRPTHDGNHAAPCISHLWRPTVFAASQQLPASPPRDG